MLMKGYCFIDDYIISSYVCFMFLKAISEGIWITQNHSYGNIEQIMK